MDSLFENEINKYVHKIDSIFESSNFVMYALKSIQKQQAETIKNTYKEEILDEVDGDEYQEIKLKIPYDKLSGFMRHIKRMEQFKIGNEIFPKSFVVMLVSLFDAYVGCLIRTIFCIKPEILNASEKAMTYGDLLQYPSIDDAKEYIIEKEIEDVLRRSHEDQFRWLENKLKINLNKELPSWPDFIEITERRNLFVHVDGNVSSQYINVCKKHSVKFEKDYKVGESLTVSKDYLKKSYNVLLEIGVKLGHVLWRKLKEDEIKIADSNMNLVCYELLVNNKYDLALELLKFATEIIKKHSSEEMRLTLIVNKAQAYKWLGDNEAVNNIVTSIDWSAYSDLFKLAYNVLIDNYSMASEIMLKIGNSKEISKLDYKEWPLFKEFRKTKEFMDAYEKIFSEKLNI